MAEDWADRYRDLIGRLPGVAASAPLTLCGSGACIDARVSLHDIGPMLTSDHPDARFFGLMLQARAARGQGGEVAADWADGPAWIMQALPTSLALGGTGPHAAATLSAIGAPALLALQDRSALMLSLAPSTVLLAEGERLVTVASADRRGAARPPVFIFEYTAGRPIGAVVPERSSRIIVRFGNFPLEHDLDFDRMTVAHAAEAGAGLVSGFSSVAAADLEAELTRVTTLVRAWRAEGLATVHLELAGFETLELMRATLKQARGVVTSVGMSLSELHMLSGRDARLADAMQALGENLAVDRVCVHADHWAASVTRRDPEAEMEALMTGCLLASARAACGRPVLPQHLDTAAVFEPLRLDALSQAGPWRFVACASPYLRSPETTLGLGDTFTGGCLLALGSRRA